MRVVELADEFGLTTNEALDVCDRAGIPASSGGASVSVADAERFRATMAEPAPPVTGAHGAAPEGVPDEWLQPGTIEGDTSPQPGTIVAPVRRPTKRRKYKKVRMSYASQDDALTGLMALVLSPLPLVGLTMTGWSAGSGPPARTRSRAPSPARPGCWPGRWSPVAGDESGARTAGGQPSAEITT